MDYSLQSLLDAPIIELDVIDSTNNYAMQLIDADTAQPGTTIVARNQTQGRGQRGKNWMGNDGESLMFSLIVKPNWRIDQQFIFNCAVAVAIADVLCRLYEGWDVRIKWPNDIIINDKKAGGVLVENVLRGNDWVHSVVGLGLNVLQAKMSADLPFSTSLRLASQKEFSLQELLKEIRKAILKVCCLPLSAAIMEQYNSYLFRHNSMQLFTDDKETWVAKVIGATTNGTLTVELADGSIVSYQHGLVRWQW
ncbi:MAG: biotin--[acetyl-CoA-carboxylase] ligase [Bacteroidetes bacterium]|nr:biotin--[acetyl-CoA-carboxylase] ligase [Bacteroidota bacterium]